MRETRRQRHGDEGGEFGEEDDGASEETRGGGDAGKPSGGDGAADATHWKGVIAGGAHADALASSLAASRLVACAQVSADGILHLKTVSGAREPIGEHVNRDAAAAGVEPPPIMWRPIVGNAAYLEWVTAETRARCDAAAG